MAKKMRTEPMNTKISSHNIIKLLVKHGMKEPAAEELIEFIEERTQVETKDLATRADLALVKQEVAHIRETMATKADLEKTNAAIEKSKNEILRWNIGSLIAIASIIIACFRYFGR